MSIAKSTAKFVQLERGNDWGSTYLAYKALSDAGTADVRYGIRAKEGDRVEVKWPNGSITKEKLVMQQETMRVSDHGHESTATSQIPGFVAKIRGVQVWLALDAKGLKVRADAFQGYP